MILAVPDARIAEVAQRVDIGPWVAHLSGATSVTALAPHERRFVVHPLQTLTRDRGAEQLDGAWGAMTFETDAAAAAAEWLATTLGLRPFVLADADKPIYHAGAAVASNFLVTLERVAARLVGGSRRARRGAGAAHAAHHRERLPADRPHRPRRHLDRRGAPRRARGPRAGPRGAVPGAGRGDEAVSRETPLPIARTVDAVRAALQPPRERRERIGLVPTMGAFHEGHLALMRAARAECDVVVVSLFVNPAQFGPAEDLDRYPRDEAGDARAAAGAGVDLLFAPTVR